VITAVSTHQDGSRVIHLFLSLVLAPQEHAEQENQHNGRELDITMENVDVVNMKELFCSLGKLSSCKMKALQGVVMVN